MGHSDSAVGVPDCQSREAGSSPPDVVSKLRQFRLSRIVCEEGRYATCCWSFYQVSLQREVKCPTQLKVNQLSKNYQHEIKLRYNLRICVLLGSDRYHHSVSSFQVFLTSLLGIFYLTHA